MCWVISCLIFLLVKLLLLLDWDLGLIFKFRIFVRLIKVIYWVCNKFRLVGVDFLNFNLLFLDCRCLVNLNIMVKLLVKLKLLFIVFWNVIVYWFVLGFRGVNVNF